MGSYDDRQLKKHGAWTGRPLGGGQFSASVAARSNGLSRHLYERYGVVDRAEVKPPLLGRDVAHHATWASSIAKRTGVLSNQISRLGHTHIQMLPLVWHNPLLRTRLFCSGGIGWHHESTDVSSPLTVMREVEPSSGSETEKESYMFESASVRGRPLQMRGIAGIHHALLRKPMATLADPKDRLLNVSGPFNPMVGIRTSATASNRPRITRKATGPSMHDGGLGQFVQRTMLGPAVSDSEQGGSGLGSIEELSRNRDELSVRNSSGVPEVAQVATGRHVPMSIVESRISPVALATSCFSADIAKKVLRTPATQEKAFPGGLPRTHDEPIRSYAQGVHTAPLKNASLQSAFLGQDGGLEIQRSLMATRANELPRVVADAYILQKTADVASPSHSHEEGSSQRDRLKVGRLGVLRDPDISSGDPGKTEPVVHRKGEATRDLTAGVLQPQPREQVFSPRMTYSKVDDAHLAAKGSSEVPGSRNRPPLLGAFPSVESTNTVMRKQGPFSWAWQLVSNRTKPMSQFSEIVNRKAQAEYIEDVSEDEGFSKGPARGMQRAAIIQSKAFGRASSVAAGRPELSAIGSVKVPQAPPFQLKKPSSLFAQESSTVRRKSDGIEMVLAMPQTRPSNLGDHQEISLVSDDRHISMSAASETQQSEIGGSGRAAEQNPEQLASQVYAIIKRRLIAERERMGASGVR